MYVNMIYIIISFSIILVTVLFKIIVAYKKEKNSISFKEALNLTNLPIITFYQNEEKINFILDTGATLSTIDERKFKHLKSKQTDRMTRMHGLTGGADCNNVVEMTFKYKNDEFVDNFQVFDLSDVLDSIKKVTGVTVHGILGTSFMTKYKYVLNFDEMIAYKNSKLFLMKDYVNN